jgi:hypothetical protein
VFNTMFTKAGRYSESNESSSHIVMCISDYRQSLDW